MNLLLRGWHHHHWGLRGSLSRHGSLDLMCNGLLHSALGFRVCRVTMNNFASTLFRHLSASFDFLQLGSEPILDGLKYAGREYRHETLLQVLDRCLDCKVYLLWNNVFHHKFVLFHYHFVLFLKFCCQPAKTCLYALRVCYDGFGFRDACIT